MSAGIVAGSGQVVVESSLCVESIHFGSYDEQSARRNLDLLV
jgi:hypothetical protein